MQYAPPLHRATPPVPEGEGCFYRIGKFSFYALLLVGLPAAAVWLFYDRIETAIEGVSSLPVFAEMQDNFRSGAEIAGVVFAEKLRAFYQMDTLGASSPIPLEPGALPRKAFWHRNAVQADLTQRLPGRKQGNVLAYLDYIEKFRPLALAEMQRAKIPASVTLAQGLLEADAGRGFLAARANNHFGIKCRLRAAARRDGSINRADFTPADALAIDCVQRADDYAWDHFEVYASPAASFRRHSLLLQGSRYGWMIPAYEVGQVYDLPRRLFGHSRAPYYAAWSLGLKSSGYATAPAYAEKLTLIIETYQLWKIDYEALL